MFRKFPHEHTGVETAVATLQRGAHFFFFMRWVVGLHINMPAYPVVDGICGAFTVPQTNEGEGEFLEEFVYVRVVLVEFDKPHHSVLAHF